MKRLLSCLLIVALVFSMTACSLFSKPETIVTKFCKSLKTFNMDEAASCFVSNKLDFALPSDEDLAEIKEVIPEKAIDHFKKWFLKMDYKVGEATVNGDTATVPVTFTYVDASPVLTAALGEYITQALGLAFSGADEDAIEELFGTILLEKLETVETKTATTEIEFVCVKHDGDWKIQDLSEETQDQITNIISCNIMKTMEDYVGKLADSFDFD